MVEDSLRHFLFVAMRWLHIVCTTLIVGGTLFFQFVVPIAIEDLKSEQQLATFGKARWVFKRVVWACALLLIISGGTTFYRMASTYTSELYRPSLYVAMAHIALALVALTIAVSLTYSGTPPARPITWMRIDLAVLLLAILAAVTTRHVRLTIREKYEPSRMNLRPVATMPHEVVAPHE